MKKIYNFIISQKALLKKVLPITLLRKSNLLIKNIALMTYHSTPLSRRNFQKTRKGINLIGDSQIEIGLGQSMRLLANQLSLSNYDFVINNFSLTSNARRNDHTWDHKLSSDNPFCINIFHINPQELPLAYLSLGKSVWNNRYNIGFWLWELETFPKEHLSALKFVDEIWTPSEFTSNCFRKITDKPVHTIPYYVTAEADPQYDRTYFQLPDSQFLFLIMFDYNSTILRKNPLAAIEAFKKAFSPDCTDVGLVIKVNNPTDACMDLLHAHLNGYSNVYYVTEILSKTEVNSLIKCADVFVSLHRAEGFGLVMAEAMLLKTACIATNWSSNTEFMNSDTACMVPYTMIQTGKGEGSYPDGAIWADPSVDAASAYMKRLKEDSLYYEEIITNAYSHIRAVLGKDRIIGLLEQRIAEINEKIV